MLNRFISKLKDLTGHEFAFRTSRSGTFKRYHSLTIIHIKLVFSSAMLIRMKWSTNYTFLFYDL